MGLFDGGNQSKDAQNEVINVLSEKNKEILDNLVFTLNKNFSWTFSCTGYYDDRERTVFVNKDSFCVKMKKYHLETSALGETQIVYDEPEFVVFNYTETGYMPLHAFTASNGKCVALNKVVFLLATVIMDRMKSEFPDCAFGNVYEDDGCVSRFTYKVPTLDWIDWF